MGDLDTNPAASLGPHSTLEPSAGSIHELPQLSPPPPALGQEPQDPFNSWETIGGQRDFYDERDCLGPSYNLASEKLQDRGRDDVVIFGYPLDPDHLSHVDGDPLAAGGCPSSGRFSTDNDIFFRVPKSELIESEKFNQIINPAKEPRLIQSQGPRLAIIDFPQCYDTYDDGLLNLMGEKLGLQRKSETAFMDAYLRRVRALPGRGRFRTGISSRAPFKNHRSRPCRVHRKIAVLQDLHTVFLTSYRTKTSDYEKGYPLRRNPFYKNIIPISILSEYPEQIWPNTLEIISEMVRKRERLIRKIKGLVENMEIRRKILLGFLKSDNEAKAVMKRTEDTMRETRAILMQQMQQTQTLSVFTVVTTAFLPLSFCASYFGMNNIKEFNEHPLSRNDFWQITGPLCAGIILLAVIVIFWERPIAARFRAYVRRKLGLSLKEKIDDVEDQRQGYRPSRNSISAATPRSSSRVPGLLR